MRTSYRHRVSDPFIRTCGYVGVLLLCAGLVFLVSRTHNSKPYLRVTFTRIDLDDDGTLRTDGTGECTAPIRISDYLLDNNNVMSGVSRADGGGSFSAMPWPCKSEGKIGSASAVREVDGKPMVIEDEFSHSFRSVEDTATVGKTYELHAGESLTVCRVRGKTGHVYERRIEVSDPESAVGDGFTRQLNR